MQSDFATQRMIADIRNDDVKIQVRGYIKDLQNGKSFRLDDKTGELKVEFKAEEISFDYKDGDLVNVIGDLRIITSGEKILEAEIIQDMSGLNFEDYQKIYRLKKEILEKEKI
jgi:uncharacterized protein YdeI (BOF family)